MRTCTNEMIQIWYTYIRQRGRRGAKKETGPKSEPSVRFCCVFTPLIMWMQFKLPASHHHHQPWKKGGGELIHQQWDSLSLSLCGSIGPFAFQVKWWTRMMNVSGEMIGRTKGLERRVTWGRWCGRHTHAIASSVTRCNSRRDESPPLA